MHFIAILALIFFSQFHHSSVMENLAASDDMAVKMMEKFAQDPIVQVPVCVMIHEDEIEKTGFSYIDDTSSACTRYTLKTDNLYHTASVEFLTNKESITFEKLKLSAGQKNAASPTKTKVALYKNQVIVEQIETETAGSPSQKKLSCELITRVLPGLLTVKTFVNANKVQDASLVCDQSLAVMDEIIEHHLKPVSGLYCISPITVKNILEQKYHLFQWTRSCQEVMYGKTKKTKLGDPGLSVLISVYKGETKWGFYQYKYHNKYFTIQEYQSKDPHSSSHNSSSGKVKLSKNTYMEITVTAKDTDARALKSLARDIIHSEIDTHK